MLSADSLSVQKSSPAIEKIRQLSNQKLFFSVINHLSSYAK